MAKQVDASWTRDQIDRFLGALAVAGLLHDRGQGIFEMHPALTGFLRATRPPGAAGGPGEPWSRAFVDLMGTLADDLAPRELHEQRVPVLPASARISTSPWGRPSAWGWTSISRR